jgi:hypothetical protein
MVIGGSIDHVQAAFTGGCGRTPVCYVKRSTTVQTGVRQIIQIPGMSLLMAQVRVVRPKRFGSGSAWGDGCG